MLGKVRLSKIMLPLASQDDTKAMRSFALTMSLAFPAVFMLLLPWIFKQPMPLWPAAIAGLLMLFYVVYARAIYYPYRIWMFVASILGWINTKLILGVVFFLVITPIGLIMKSFGKLQYKKQVSSESNWVQQDHNDARKDKKRLEEPF